MKRRDFLKTGVLAGATIAGLSGQKLRADVPSHRWDNYDFGAPPQFSDRLNQGPFGIEQDAGWYTIAVTSPTNKKIKNYGLGLVGYTWEESGPGLDVRSGKISLEKQIEKLASLPFVDVLYIRCDWRDVQSRAGKLDLQPVWKLTLEAAKHYGLRVGFRIQMSKPEQQPKQLALPDFLQTRVPLVKIGSKSDKSFEFVEPRYDHSVFLSAFRELNELLATEFDGNPLIEYADLMMYGFWGEAHTSNLKNPFPDYPTAEKTFVNLTKIQLDTWKKTPLAVNTQPDISLVGNNEVLDMCVRAGCWLRSDSVVIEEPIQIEELSNRPPWLAVIMEDGYYRQYNPDPKYLSIDEAGINILEKWMLLNLNLGANYWSLWTEADNLKRYNEQFPNGFQALQNRLGYRVRPAWVWQRKRFDTSEIIVAVANDGVAGVPGALRLSVESLDGNLKISGTLDAGHPFPGKLRQASFLLPKDFNEKQLKIRAEIETGGGWRRPVNWACAQNLNQDGTLTISLLGQDDKKWRKGV